MELKDTPYLFAEEQAMLLIDALSFFKSIILPSKATENTFHVIK